MTDFQVGDKVTWTSQSGGSTKTKTGVVREVIRSTYELWYTRWEYKSAKTHMLMFDGNTLHGSVVYFVEVQAGPKAKPRLYMPYPNKLRLVEAE